MSEEILSVFERAGAYLRGHFLLTSGRHSDVYFEKFMLLQHPDVLTELCARLAALFPQREIQTVVGPTLGGALIAYELARQLDSRAVYAEADGDQRILRRDARGLLERRQGSRVVAAACRTRCPFGHLTG